ncbi:homocysteine S-methyltransferase family protein [Rhizobium sp. 16-449-1b]|uniref:homocysteine S-methyltransferase family protein n=1 Tax=Rhizobium sp. 16-449-1b TaxID=2819989 RepID=UPI001ADBAB99|nr:homocysteine S-methyltransferase family protein [Rhizobium sp. 16-449-1b]MBO9193505.1 homocysteine S-methyltransferase family protein [Rhizobium sp. 16-449-1b]
MAKYRAHLPQIDGGFYASDGGMETTFIFHDGMELPHFASFVMVDDEEGRDRLLVYYRRYLDIARKHRTGFILDTPTWRANPDWGEKLGYDAEALHRVNLAAIDLLLPLREKYEEPGRPIVISGAIGPRGDGYKAGNMNAAEAEDYHGAQIRSFATSEADMVAAYTLTNIDEAIGVARAAAANNMPCAISFTVETDGRLVTGRSLQDAIETTDAATGGSPAYYMINCAHPTHFAGALDANSGWTRRIGGLRANASRMSHAELDESETLDAGDPSDLGERYRVLLREMPDIRIVGGCCGTDHRHVAAICEACVPAAA